MNAFDLQVSRRNLLKQAGIGAGGAVAAAIAPGIFGQALAAEKAGGPFKLIIGWERRPDITRDYAQEHLANVHPMMLKSVPEFFDRVIGYAQNAAVGDQTALSASDFDPDAVVALWYASVEEMGASFSEPRYVEIIRPDELRFANPKRLIVTVAAEDVRWDGNQTGGLKFIRFVAPGAKAADASAMNSWKQDYSKLLEGSAEFKARATRYVRNWPVPVQGGFPTIQEIVNVEEFWLAEGTSAEDFLALEKAALKGGGLDLSAVDLAASAAFVGKEKVVKALAD